MTELSDFRATRFVTSAFEKAKRLLLEPFDAWVWIKLMVIMFFVGSASYSPNTNYNLGEDDLRPWRGLSTQEVRDIVSTDWFIFGVIAVIALIVLLVVAMWALRAIFSFVLIDAVSTGDVRIVRPFMDNLRRGLKLFLADLVVRVPLILLGIIAAVAVILWLYRLIIADPDALSGSAFYSSLAAFFVAIACLGCIILPLSLALNVVTGFLYDFVAPLMYFRGMGLKAAIGEVWSLIVREPAQFIVYVLLYWVLQIVTGILLLIPILILVAIFVVFTLACVFLGIALAAMVSWLWVLAAAAFLIGLALFILAVSAITMPVGMYFRYFSLDFLRSFDPTYVRYAPRVLPQAGTPAP